MHWDFWDFWDFMAHNKNENNFGLFALPVEQRVECGAVQHGG